MDYNHYLVLNCERTIPGVRGEDICAICLDAILPNTPTASHNSCQNTFCRNCLLTVLLGESGQCPKCRVSLRTGESGILPEADTSMIQSWLKYREKVYDTRLDLKLASRTAADVEKVVNRLYHRDLVWQAGRWAENMVQDIQSLYEQKADQRKGRLTQELEDDIAESVDKQAMRDRNSTRRTREERERGIARSDRKAVREKEFELELNEVVVGWFYVENR